MKLVIIQILMVVMPFVAFAARETIDGIEWSFRVKDGNAEIDSAASSNAVDSITIPSTLGGCPVTKIGKDDFNRGFGYRVFGRCSTMKSVAVPTTVTSIGDSAFCGCSNLIVVALSSNVMNIGRCAFGNCSKLKSFMVDAGNPKFSSRDGLLCAKNGEVLVAGVNGDVTIPQGIEQIGRYAFYGCRGLKSVSFPSTLKSIDLFAFSNCSALKTVTLPSGVASIGWYAFNQCAGLTSFVVDEANIRYSSRDGLLCSKNGTELIFGVNGNVIIPMGVHKIGRCAFFGCRGLNSVKIPETVTRIEDGAFMGCSGLVTLSIPASVTNVVGSFSGCTGLMSYEVSEGNPIYRSINGLLCSKDGTTIIRGVGGDVTIPNGVTTIEKCAFSGCAGLTSVVIPPSVTNIGAFAFRGCRDLQSVIVPSRVERIEERTFGMCHKLKDVVIPEGVTHIGDGAFLGCHGLEAVSLPQGLTHIGEYAFNGCRGLKSVTLPSSVNHIARCAFSVCPNLAHILIPSTVKSIGMRAFANTLFYDSMPDGPVILGDGVLYKYKGACASAITIPPSVKRIGENAFANCTNLTSMTISSSVTNIDGRAFVNCRNLKSVTVLRDAEVETMAFEDWFRPWKDVVAQRLQQCDYLINKNFKRGAKVYLCLFSASWCGPCRREMPRIAKVYAKVLQDDPDVELIHFSRDRSDEQALAWAKECNVRFPVVSVNGGNPLNLDPAGIPHLFILTSDGICVAKGHPSELYTVEKLLKYCGEKSRAALTSLAVDKNPRSLKLRRKKQKK